MAKLDDQVLEAMTKRAKAISRKAYCPYSDGSLRCLSAGDQRIRSRCHDLRSLQRKRNPEGQAV